MLNVNELESRWRKYKIKAYIPHAVIVISLVIIFVLGSTIYNSKTVIKELSELKEEKDTKLVKEKVVAKPIKQNITEVAKRAKEEPKKVVEANEQQEKKKVTLLPSLGFMSEMKHNPVTPYEHNDVIPPSTYKKTKSTKPKPKKVKKKQTVLLKEQPIIIEQKVKEEPVKASNILIQRQNTQEDISHVIKRFKKNNNPALSLFVAKKYYELGEFHKAYNYALITNEINDNIDACWIIFAKSLVKLNEKDEAVKTLKKYIEHSHSSQAKILLEEIVSGKFK